MNTPSVIVGAVAFLCCVILLPVVKIISNRYSLFDSPGPLRIHTRPTSRLGGVAIVLSIALGISFSGRIDLRTGSTFFAALFLIWVTGLADDIWGLPPVFRLAAQIAAGSMLWLGGGPIPASAGGIGGFLAICLIVVTFVNAFNFIDGADGLLAGVTAIIAVTFLLQSHGLQLSFSTSIAWAVAGSCLGFLLFNFPPASIFMGDSGSTVLGLVAAFFAINLYRATEAAPLAFTAAFLPAALPLIDAALAILRRMHMHSSPLNGDRRHIYDLLMVRRWAARKVVFVCYGITGIFCLAAWLTIRCAYGWGITTSAVTAGVFLALEWRLGSLKIPDNSTPEATTLRLPNIFENTK